MEFTRTSMYKINPNISDQEFLSAMRAAVGAIDIQFGQDVIDRVDESNRHLFQEVIFKKEESNGKTTTEGIAENPGSADGGQPG